MSEQKFYPFHQSPFYKLCSKKKLSALLGLTTSKLRFFESGGLSYTEWDEPKKSGGYRHIENPAYPLKVLQRKIAKKLLKIVVPDYLFCPAKYRSFIHNAKEHANNHVVRTLDVKQYFLSTSSKRVFWFWHKRMNCASNIAGILTMLCCWNEHLPTGSPSSPILSFYAHIDMWENIAAIAREAECTLTVYIDDITISGVRVPDNVLWKIKQEIHKTGLRYHKEKVFLSGWSEVTGIIIRNNEIMVPNRVLKTIHELRLEIHSEIDLTRKKQLEKRMSSYTVHVRQVGKVDNLTISPNVAEISPPR